jgi:hypothetical protein
MARRHLVASLLLASLFISGCDDAGEVRDEYTDVARPGLVIASDTLRGLGLDVVAADELPNASHLERSEDCDCYMVPLGNVSLESIDGEYYLAMDAVGEAVFSAGYGSVSEKVDLHTHQDIYFQRGSWWLYMVATDLAWDDNHLEAQWLNVYAYAGIDGAFES